MRTVDPSPYGQLLRRWRGLRGRSQQDLALDSGVSARHISFVETGRSRPSRRMILRLADALDVPLRERNRMLLAAGLAPAYPERRLDQGSMREARRMLRLVLEQHEPFPALVLDRCWNVVQANRSLEAHLRLSLPSGHPAGGLNVLRLLLDPGQLRPAIVNWQQAAAALLRRARREVRGDADPLCSLIDEVVRLPGVRELETLDPEAADAPFLPLEVRVGSRTMSWITVLASFGTPQDVTLQELRIESLLPLDERTEELARDIALRDRMERRAAADAPV
jgi:transcriptional regulator with XRE-family HTH domain